MALEHYRRAAAIQDIEDIWLHIAADSVAAATAQVERIERAELRLCEFLELGQARPDIDANLRHWPDGSYVILYQVAATRLEVVRILHGARDLGALFAADTP